MMLVLSVSFAICMSFPHYLYRLTNKKDLWVFCYIVNTNYTMALYKIAIAPNNATFAGTLFLLAVQVNFFMYHPNPSLCESFFHCQSS